MPCSRGTSNSNRRGNSTDRRRRREWLVKTYRANVDVVVVRWPDGREDIVPELIPGVMVDVESVHTFFPECEVEQRPACRCYRCGRLLTVDTVSPDRIKPGIDGGSYRRENIRPACEDCQSSTGGALGAARKKAKAGVR